MKQPLIAAIEAGHRRPSDPARAALDRALAIRPSVALATRKDEVRALFTRAGLPEPRVVGSVARGDDQESSDLDLIVEFTDRHDILIQVATVVEKLPAPFKDASDDIDWAAIGRMRNLIAHHYDKVDGRLVFSALARRIPDLLGRLGVDV